jgi:hypothetical protein
MNKISVEIYSHIYFFLEEKELSPNECIIIDMNDILF